MDELIKKATKEITQTSVPEEPITPLMECSLAIAKEAMLGRSGKLRDIALEIAKAIADYDWEQRAPVE